MNSCKYVDKIIMNSPLVINKEFINKHNIDLVCHGFNDLNDIKKQEEFFRIPKIK